MQTVIGIQAGSGAAVAQEPRSAGADDGVFPATLRQAMAPADGTPPGNLPPAAGKAPPPDTSAAPPAAAPAPTAAAASTDAAAVTDAAGAVVELPTAPLAPASPSSLAEAAGAPEPAPHISAVLQDIATARGAANPARVAPAEAAPTAVVEAPPTAPAAEGAPLPQSTGAGNRRTDKTQDDTAEADLAAASGGDPALLAPNAVLAAPAGVPQAQVAPPPAGASGQPAAAVTTAPGRGQAVVGTGAGGLTARPRPAPADADDAEAAQAEPPTTASDRRPSAPVSEAATKTPAAPAASMPAAAVPGAAAGVSAATLSASTLAASTLAASTLGTPAAVATGPADTATSGRVPDVAIDAPPGSPQFGPQLGERLLWLVRDGIHEARLQLNPRELGPVEVRLSVGDGAAQLSFSAQHAGTAAAVQQSLPQLRDLLAQQGLQLGQASVFHQAGAGGEGAAGQRQAQHSGAPWAPAGDGGLAFDDGLATPAARVIGRGLVDAYA